MAENLDVHALTPDRWADLEVLLGPKGACYDCWCSYFTIAAAQRKLMDGEAKRSAMRSEVENGPPPGVIGYRDDVPVGWVRVGPRSAVPRWNSDRTVSRPLEADDAADPGVWAVSCFFIATKSRGKGYSHDLLAGAISFARQSGARWLEACPMDKASQSKSVGLYVGSTRVFHAAGFEQIALRKDGRPLMRFNLSGQGG